MHVGRSRLLSIAAVTGAAVALTAPPALAGSDGCGDDESCSPPPVQPLPAPTGPAQVPVAPAPAPVPESSSPSSSVRSEHRSQPGHRTVRRSQVRAQTFVRGTSARRTITIGASPRGGVQAGAGGTAADGSEGIVTGLLGASLILVASGGGLVARRLRATS